MAAIKMSTCGSAKPVAEPSLTAMRAGSASHLRRESSQQISVTLVDPRTGNHSDKQSAHVSLTNTGVGQGLLSGARERPLDSRYGNGGSTSCPRVRRSKPGG